MEILKKLKHGFKTILKITINEMFKNHIETANTTVGNQTNMHFSHSQHTQ